MAIPACANAAVFHSDGSNSTGAVAAARVQLFTFGTPPGPDLIGTVQWTGIGSLLSGFRASVWLASGPGPTYTDRLELVTLAGAQAAGTTVTHSIPLDQELPGIGRPFNPTTDAIFGVHNNQYVASGDFTQSETYWQVCSAAASTDCCAEVLAKLDEVLASIRRVYPRTP